MASAVAQFLIDSEGLLEVFLGLVEITPPAIDDAQVAEVLRLAPTVANFLIDG